MTVVVILAVDSGRGSVGPTRRVTPETLQSGLDSRLPETVVSACGPFCDWCRPCGNAPADGWPLASQSSMGCLPSSPSPGSFPGI